jgi:hypothetical protein
MRPRRFGAGALAEGLARRSIESAAVVSLGLLQSPAPRLDCRQEVDHELQQLG